MAGQQPGTLRSNELPDYSFSGPFGGIQSEVSLDRIGRTGFAEVQNILFRKSQAQLVPKFNPLLPGPVIGTEILDLVGKISEQTWIIESLVNVVSTDPIMGMADFFNVRGNRIFVVWTPKRMFARLGGGWQQIPGTLSGTDQQFFSWDVIGYKLYFSQRADKVQVWDGLASSFSLASASSVPAKYLCELDYHLLIANTLEGANYAPNRLRWSGAGDGTDWTSFNSGQYDIFNGLGPINGLARVYQAGYAFQQWGISQILPTGNGLAPFQIIGMGSKAKGCILPYSVASFGDVVACYVGKNDVYVFDGTYSNGIGSMPIDGNRRLGARSRIFNDLFGTRQSDVFGFISTSDNGVDYEAYWLFIPALNKAWVYHFDESNWTQVMFGAGRLKGPVGIFSTQSVPRIEDLVGTIRSQSWTPISLSNVNPLDTMAISDAKLNTVALLSPGQPSDSPTAGSINDESDGWYIKSGDLTFDDPRHEHTVKKCRLCVIDYAPITINIRFTNEQGQEDLETLSYGTGSGRTLTRVVPINIPGRYITWELSGPKGVNFGLVEIAPIYDVGGEIRGD